MTVLTWLAHSPIGGFTKVAAAGMLVWVIDTERGSASKYADRFSFDVLELEDQSIDGYVAAIREAGAAGYTVLVIDSLSHGWQTLLEEIEKLAKAKYRGNTWSAWSEGTPLQRRLVQAILAYPGHVLATMRSKTEWTTVDDGRGKKSPQRVGLAPEQGKGVEYEFDLLVEISTEHIANVIKDRTGKYQDKLLEKPGEQFGRELAAWLADGDPAPAKPVKVEPVKAEPVNVEEIAGHIRTAKTVRSLGNMVTRLDTMLSEGQITDDQWSELTDLANARHDEIEPRTEAAT